MKKIIIAIIIIVLIIIGVHAFSHAPAVMPVPAQSESVVGCYATDTNPDLYTLHVASQTGENVSGTISFHNAQKDSSSGTFTGTYHDNVLLADYTFQSEGTTSVMQVAFKRSGNDFVRGYGDVDSTGTHFTDVASLTYDATSPLAVFKSTPCATDTSDTAITFPKGGEKLVAGHTYTLTWTGGSDPTQIFLIDTSLIPVGASVSSVDRVYGLKNTGTFSYTIPKTVKPGTYQLEIGNTTSNTFTVVSS